MKINELAKKTGLTISAIRFYERVGLLDAHHMRRMDNNYREYYDEAVEHLLILKEVQAAGFTLAEFKALDDACRAGAGFVTQKTVELIWQKISKVREKITELEQVESFLTGKLTELLQEETPSI